VLPPFDIDGTLVREDPLERRPARAAAIDAIPPSDAAPAATSTHSETAHDILCPPAGVTPDRIDAHRHEAPHP
jgi:hypothetical protein